jgi:Uma2 family endonuclease
LPPERIEDIDLVKDYLFATMGQSYWTDAEYVAYSERYPRLTELSEGRLVMHEVPTPNHQRVVKRVLQILDRWAQRSGGEALMAPMPVRLWLGKFREPDVMLCSSEHRERIGEDYGGPPDLVVEVQSPGTARLDSNEKLAEYAQAGIPEYWKIVVEPSGRLEQYVLVGDSYALRAEVRAGDTLRSEVFPDLRLRLADVFSPEPKTRRK